MNSNTDIEYFQQKIKQIIYCNLNLAVKSNFPFQRDMDEMIELSKKTPYINEMFYMLIQYLLDIERYSSADIRFIPSIHNLSDDIKFFVWKQNMIKNMLESDNIQPNLKKIFLTVSDGKNEISFYETVFKSCLTYKCAYLTMQMFKFRKIFISKQDLIDFFKVIEETSIASPHELVQWKKQNVYSFILERIVLFENQFVFQEYLYILNVFLVLYDKSFLYDQLIFDKPPYLMLFLDILEWKIFEKIWREKIISLFIYMNDELQKKYNSFYMYKMRPHIGSPRTDLRVSINTPSPNGSGLESNKSRMLSFFEENRLDF